MKTFIVFILLTCSVFACDKPGCTPEGCDICTIHSKHYVDLSQPTIVVDTVWGYYVFWVQDTLNPPKGRFDTLSYILSIDTTVVEDATVGYNLPYSPKQPLRMKIDTVRVNTAKYKGGYELHSITYFEYDTTYYLTLEQVKILEGR